MKLSLTSDLLDGGLGEALRETGAAQSSSSQFPAGRGPDRISGTAASDTIEGLGGRDTLFGLGGSDQLFGGRGRDSLIAGGGRDTAFGGGGRDVLDGGGGKDLLDGGGGADVLFGGGGKDHLIGGGGSDRLFGGGGADTLEGGFGNDTLEGGRSRDTFVFRAESVSAGDRDTVLDFERRDRLDLEGFTQDTAIITEIGEDFLTLSLRDDFMPATVRFINLDAAGIRKIQTEVSDLPALIEPDAEAIRNSDLLGVIEETIQIFLELDFEPEFLRENGTEGRDQMIGTRNDDVIQGFGGADRIFTSDGADQLFGGAGADAFTILEFLPAGSDINTIMDFQPGDILAVAGALGDTIYWSLNDRLRLQQDGDDAILLSRLDDFEAWTPTLRINRLGETLSQPGIDKRSLLEAITDASQIKREAEGNVHANLGAVPEIGFLNSHAEVPSLGVELNFADLFYLGPGEQVDFRLSEAREVRLVTPGRAELIELGVPRRGADNLESATISAQVIELSFDLPQPSDEISSSDRIDLGELPPLTETSFYDIAVRADDQDVSGLFYLELI